MQSGVAPFVTKPIVAALSKPIALLTYVECFTSLMESLLFFAGPDLLSQTFAQH